MTTPEVPRNGRETGDYVSDLKSSMVSSAPLLLIGVPEPALSSLRAVGLSLAWVDSLEGTLDPDNVVNNLSF